MAAPALRRSLARASDSGGGQQQQKRGQEALYKDGQKSKRFVDVTKDKTRASGAQVHLMLDDEQTYIHCNTDKQVYVGGEAGKHHVRDAGDARRPVLEQPGPDRLIAHGGPMFPISGWFRTARFQTTRSRSIGSLLADGTLDDTQALATAVCIALGTNALARRTT